MPLGTTFLIRIFNQAAVRMWRKIHRTEFETEIIKIATENPLCFLCVCEKHRYPRLKVKVHNSMEKVSAEIIVGFYFTSYPIFAEALCVCS